MDLKFSCVILTYNRKDVLKKCLLAVAENTYERRCNYEVIVVNNCSNDGTLKLLDIMGGQFDNYKVLNLNRNYGVIARNRAFNLARGKYIVQIDDDVLVQKNWDKEVFKYFRNPQVGAVGTEGSKWIGWVNKHNKDIKIGDYVDFLTGQFWVFKNESWLYDESFGHFWHEESDLQMWMKYRKKYRFCQCNRNVIRHLELRSEKTMDWKLHDKNWQMFVDKWKPRENQLNLEGKNAKVL